MQIYATVYISFNNLEVLGQNDKGWKRFSVAKVENLNSYGDYFSSYRELNDSRDMGVIDTNFR